MAIDNKVTVKSRVRPKLKEEAEKILKALGLNMSSAITIYLQQITQKKGLPFDMRIPSQEVLDALNEDLTDAKRYSDTGEFWKDIGIDPTANSKS